MNTGRSVRLMERADDRAQATQVGAVLLLGILVVSLSLYQVTVVPQENREVEFNDYLDASADMVSVSNDVSAAGQRGVQSATTVRTGGRYPARALFINPPPPAGRVRTVPEGDEPVSFHGVTVADGEDANARAFWDETNQSYATKSVRFDPDYNRLDVSAVETTPFGVYRLSENGPIPLTGQSFVRGNVITLVTIEGNLSAGGFATPVSVDPVSASVRTVTVTGTGGEFNVTVPTPGNATLWVNSSVVETLVDRNANVVGVTPLPGDDSANVTFDGTQTYELRLGRVEARETDSSGTPGQPDPAYVVPTVGNDSTALTGESSTLAVEVRDRFNNPRSGVAVEFTTGNGTFARSGSGSATVRSNAEGRARVYFTPNATGNLTVNASADFAPSQTGLNETTFEFTSLDASQLAGGGATDDINPGSSGELILTSATATSKTDVRLTFNNSDTSARNITSARVSFYYPDGGNEATPDVLRIGGTDLSIPSDFQTLNNKVTIPTGTGQNGDLTLPGSKVNVNGDFFIISVRYEDEVGTTTYFVSV